MGYRRRRKRYYTDYHSDSRLNRYFEPIIEDVKKYFFSLDEYELDELFADYGDSYGSAAEAYARETYDSWKNEYVRMSDQTLMRLVETLPWFITEQQRFNLMEKLVNHYVSNIRQEYRYLYATWSNYHSVLYELKTTISREAGSYTPKVEFDSEMLNLASWLTKNDMIAAKKVIDNFYFEKNRLMVASAQNDIRRFVVLCDALKSREEIYENQDLEINLPSVRFSLTLQREKMYIFRNYLSACTSINSLLSFSL